MATALAHRAECVRNSNIFRLSFNFFRNLSSASASASASPSSASQNPTASNKSKRRKKKNFFEVAQFLPNWGIGYHMAKAHWAEVSYEITKINLYKVFFLFIYLFFYPLIRILLFCQWKSRLVCLIRACILHYISFLQDGKHGKAWGIVHKNGQSQSYYQ